MQQSNLLICCSHLYIPTVLSVCMKSAGLHYIYTDTNSIKEFFDNIDIPTNLYYDRYSYRGLVSKLLIDMKRKCRLNHWINNLAISDVYFFHEGYCEAANWLMLKLSKRKSIIFHYVPVARTEYLNEIVRGDSFKIRLREMYCLLFWGYRPVFTNKGDGCGIMPLSFYKRIGVSKEESIFIDTKIADLLFPENEIPSSAIVLLSNPHVDRGSEANSYGLFLEEVIRPLLQNHLILFKNHPDRNDYIGLERELNEIPSYISGNLLSRRFKCFVGVDSALLCEAANDGTKAICLVNLIEMDSQKKLEIIKYHKELSDFVLFPNTVEELWELI